MWFAATLLVTVLANVCRGQTTWNDGGTHANQHFNSYPSTGGYYNSYHDDGYKTWNSPQIYGPQLNRECPFNYEFVNPDNIENTRRENEQCSAEYVPCERWEHSKFRSMDGSCNNLQHPSWGRSNNCLRRILPYDYGDKISYPRMSCKGKELPAPRLISDVFHREVQNLTEPFTTMFVEWGQLLAHDVSLNDVFRTPESGYNFPVECCVNGPTISEQCVSQAVPETDTFFPQRGVTCISFVRTVPCPLCKGGQRQHWNQNTAYHDASLVYGSNEDAARRLRSGVLGMLAVEPNSKCGQLLPTMSVAELCVSPPNEKRCYRSGDPRTNANLFLLTVHTMMLRYHNFVCQELHKINPHWDDERLYQEARRILIAQIQKITFANYLPIVLGEKTLQRIGIDIKPGATYTQYDPTIDAGVIDEFTTVALRYGHSLVPGLFSEVDLHTGHRRTMRLRDTYYTPFGFKYGQFDKMAQGMTMDVKFKHDVFVTGDLRNFLYRRLYMNESTGLDLTSGAIIRGREHGVAPYTSYVKHLLNIHISSFRDMRRIVQDRFVDIMEQLFESVHDVDLYSGGLAEYVVEGGFVGPTFGYILGEQYRRFKFGDRYWFEHEDQPSPFTPEQLIEIKKTTLARIICETTQIREVQEDVFRLPSEKNIPVPCSEIPSFNFNLWKEY